MVKRVPADFPLHKFIATGGKPKDKKTTKGKIVK